MEIMGLKDGIFWIGVKNPDLKVFDIIMPTKKGTTYNSYLINDDKIAVIDTVKTGYFNDYKNNITEIIGNKKIDYIIVNHTEIDHSGSLKELLEIYPEAVVYATRPAITYLKKIVNKDFYFHTIADGENLCLGKRTIKFITAPFLHWPDTMFTYDIEDKYLFTCDAFGTHFCGDGMYNDDAGDFISEMKYYYNVIMSPFKKHVLKAMDKIQQLDIDCICASHGPIHRNNPMQYIDLYRQWSLEGLQTHQGKVVTIVYVSAYGNTKQIAQIMESKISKAGIKVNLFDISEEDLNMLIELINNSDALIVGSPTINQDAVKPVWDLLSLVSPIVNRGKIGGAFGSYGWSGEAASMISNRLKELKFKVIEPAIKINFVPSDDEKIKAEEYAAKIIEAL